MKKKTIYVTRWALTKGIQQVEAAVDDDGTYASYKPEGWFYSVYLHGRDFHLTKEAAKARAEEMRLRKIQTTEKALAKLKALGF